MYDALGLINGATPSAEWLTRREFGIIHAGGPGFENVAERLGVGA